VLLTLALSENGVIIQADRPFTNPIESASPPRSRIFAFDCWLPAANISAAGNGEEAAIFTYCSLAIVSGIFVIAAFTTF
jgi:hypothetical protein